MPYALYRKGKGGTLRKVTGNPRSIKIKKILLYGIIQKKVLKVGLKNGELKLKKGNIYENRLWTWRIL